MTATNHALAGASIGILVGEPLLAIPLAFLSHYVLDALPHFGIPGSIRERNKSLLGIIVVSTDALCFITALIAIPLFARGTSTNPWLVLVYMIAAFAPDSIYLVRFTRELKTGEFIKGGLFSRFHRRIQWCEKPWGILIEVAFAALLLLFIANKL